MDSSSAHLKSSNKDEVINQVRQQMALANAHEFVSRMTEKCFKKCINKPGAQLDGNEKRCLNMCMDRYIDSWQVVTVAYGNRLKKEHEQNE